MYDPLPVRAGIHSCREDSHPTVFKKHGNTLHAIHSARMHFHRRFHSLNLISKTHKRKINAIYPQVKQRPACQLRLDQTFLLHYRIKQIPGKHTRCPHSSLVNQIPDDLSGRHIPGPDGFCREQSLLPGMIPHLFGLAAVYAECLLADHPFSIV